MLYLWIPLGIALVAALAIAVMVWRKLPYLRKLTPESHEVGDTLLHDYAPETVDWFRSIPWRKAAHSVLTDVERALHGMRSAAGALDKASERLAKSVRRAGVQAARQHEESVAALQEEQQERATAYDADELDMDDPEQVKQEEQRLIVAIAQSPKDGKLYSDLARVYMRLHSYGDAVEALTQAVKLMPDDETLPKRLERAKRKQGEEADAAKEERKEETAG
jgi:tetratricopeptide (TPR) repeat protein